MYAEEFISQCLSGASVVPKAPKALKCLHCYFLVRTSRCGWDGTSDLSLESCGPGAVYLFCLGSKVLEAITNTNGKPLLMAYLSAPASSLVGLSYPPREGTLSRGQKCDHNASPRDKPGGA